MKKKGGEEGSGGLNTDLERVRENPPSPADRDCEGGAGKKKGGEKEGGTGRPHLKVGSFRSMVAASPVDHCVHLQLLQGSLEWLYLHARPKVTLT